MKPELPPHSSADHRPKRLPSFLEWLAAGVLCLVVLSLGWMVIVAYRPDWLRLHSLEMEVIAMLAILVASLGLVSIVALRNTRD